METKILACETLRDEVEFSLKRLGLSYPVVWVESGLHNVPKKLHVRLQESLDGMGSCERVLMAFGRCGNAYLGLKSGDYQLVIPRADDCISLLFGSDDARNRYTRENAAYFLTEGWMRGERNLWVEHQYAIQKYGEEAAEEIAEMLYGHYRQLALLDSGTYPMEKLLEKTEKIEQALHLKRKVVPVTLSYLEKLLCGPWDEKRFYLVPPGGVVTEG